MLLLIKNLYINNSKFKLLLYISVTLACYIKYITRHTQGPLAVITKNNVNLTHGNNRRIKI